MKRFVLATLSAASLGLTLASGASALKPLEFSALTYTSAPATVQIAAATGQFVTVEQDHPTTGTASVVTENGQTYVVFDEAFSTATGPDVQVVLYTEDEVPVNLEEEDYVTIAPLESFDGGQRYLIPSNIDVDEYEAVAIWCREFNVTFGYAPL
jgi:hypothetical protein